MSVRCVFSFLLVIFSCWLKKGLVFLILVVELSYFVVYRVASPSSLMVRAGMAYTGSMSL